jgi:hypothetical protein
MRAPAWTMVTSLLMAPVLASAEQPEPAGKTERAGRSEYAACLASHNRAFAATGGGATPLPNVVTRVVDNTLPGFASTGSSVETRYVRGPAFGGQADRMKFIVKQCRHYKDDRKPARSSHWGAGPRAPMARPAKSSSRDE